MCAAITDKQYFEKLQNSKILSAEKSQALKKISRSVPQPLQWALAAVLEAWEQAQLSRIPLNPDKIGLVVAAQNTSTHYQYNLYPSFQENPRISFS